MTRQKEKSLNFLGLNPVKIVSRPLDVTIDLDLRCSTQKVKDHGISLNFLLAPKMPFISYFMQQTLHNKSVTPIF